MMTLDATKAVGEFVVERPGRARVFERFGIDYCCGGKIPLQQACEKKGVNAQQVLEALQAADAAPTDTAEPDWASAPMSDLARHIVEKHHAYLREELPRLEAMTAKVASVHGQRNPALVECRDVFQGLKAELESHMFKEEQILFPLIERLETATELPQFHCGSVENPIRVMEHEHDDAGEALERLRTLTGGYVPPEDACNTYRAMLSSLEEFEADMHIHIHKENNILFPRAAAVEKSLS